MRHTVKKFQYLLMLPLITMLILPQGKAARAEDAAPAALRLLEAGSEGVVFELDVPDYHVEEIENSSNPLAELRIEGGWRTSEPGKPQLPMLSALIGIPANAKVELNILKDGKRAIDQKLNLPAAPTPGGI